MMPFTDPVSSISGRNSRASNVSGMTRASHAGHPAPQTGVPNEILANAGVLSMLKTSTDTGDIGALSFNTSRLPSMPRPIHQRRGHSARSSGIAVPHTAGPPSSHQYAPSQTSRQSSQWDAGSARRRGSLTSMRSMPPSLPHIQQPSMNGPQMPQPVAQSIRESRSYSMTSALAEQSLLRRQSINSLGSRGPDARLAARAPIDSVPLMPENRSPLVYPTRLKRPGFRSSPSFRETYVRSMPTPAPPPSFSRRPPMPRPVQSSYHMQRGEYVEETLSDPHHYVARPVRQATTLPGPNHLDPRQLPPQSGMIRPAPPSTVPNPMFPSSVYAAQHPRPASAHAAPTRAPRYATTPYRPIPMYSAFPPVQQPDVRRPHQSPGVAPTVHHLFHNAARLARTLPQRVDTPFTDPGPPSSDPPSSRSAPSSSNPPTPKDRMNIRVAVNPAIVDPALVDLPDESNEPVLSARYFEYVEGIGEYLDDSDVEIAHPSVPPSGFVQRVKAMLESKAAVETSASQHYDSDLQPVEEIHELAAEHSLVEGSDIQEPHELSANMTPRFTLIEEFIAPSELPASPVKPSTAETLSDHRSHTTRRITREMVKAELGPSSADNTLDHPEAEDTSHIMVKAERKRRHARPPSDNVMRGPGADNANDLTSSALLPESKRISSQSDDDTASTISFRANVPSGADYALRFSLHLASPRSSTETYSKDHFRLDADTTCLPKQHHESHPSQREELTNVQELTEPCSEYVLKEPISPLKADEFDVSRCSVVSPMPTLTLGIDQTLQLSERQFEKGSPDQPSIPGSFPEDLSPPTTPDASRRRSRSLQLPCSSTTSTDATSTNRLSLPGDLTSIGGATTDTSTEMVTDLAVRFSLPPTATATGKPQIVEVPSSSSPNRHIDRNAPPINSIEHRHHKTFLRSSVTFADEVAPLTIAKKSQPRANASHGCEASMSAKAKPIIRKSSPRNEPSDNDGASHDVAAEPRYAGTNIYHALNGRFGNTQLSDLKEESLEDMSNASQHRTSALMRDLDFPLPTRAAAVKAMQDRRLQESGDRARTRRALRHRNRSFAELRDLPSLNFSRMDLIDKLNDALDGRSTRSLDIVRHHDMPNIHCPSPQRPQSTEPLRERYMSFFTKPDDFSISTALAQPEDPSTSQLETNEVDSAVDIQEESESEEDEAVLHSLSPQHFLSVAQEVNRLSIPSVTGLSERLSELIPGLRNLQSLQLDALLGTWPDTGSADGAELTRPDTVLSDRTSTGFRALAERAEQIVKNGTHDSVMLTRPLALDKDLPMLPESASADHIAMPHNGSANQPYLSGSVSMPTGLGQPIVRPFPAFIESQAPPTTEEEVRKLLPQVMNPITRAANRSMTPSQASNRPWNLDENYPWASDRVDIGLSALQPAHFAASSCKGSVFPKQIAQSPKSTRRDEAAWASKGIDIGSLTDPNDTNESVTTEQVTCVGQTHTRKHSKRSIIGSITKKLGFTSHRMDDDNVSTRTTDVSPISRSASPTQNPLHLGDRYPTSGLPPPVALNVDEVRSHFSDYSSEEDSPPSAHRRRTQVKGKGKTVRINAPESVLIDSSTDNDAGTIMNAPVGTHSAMHTLEGVGMSKTEFHIKRLGEKLRHLFARGGELLRSWSMRSRVRTPRPASDDWMADSIYSGV